MTQRRLMGLFVLVGVAIPVLWFAFDSMMLRGHPRLSNYLLNTLHFDRVLLAIWPSSVLLMADPEGKSLLLPILSLLANVALYGVVGLLVWLGLRRHRAFLAVVAAGIGLGWYVLFGWYLGW